MPMLGQDSGCKVGWQYYSTKEEAEEAAKAAYSLAVSKANRGYDFGYLIPGTISEINHHEYGNCFSVIVP